MEFPFFIVTGARYGLSRCVKSMYLWRVNPYVEENKGKDKVRPYTCTEALYRPYGPIGGSRGIALPFLDYGTRKGEGSASRPGRSLPPGKTRYPLYRRLGGPQGRSG